MLLGFLFGRKPTEDPMPSNMDTINSYTRDHNAFADRMQGFVNTLSVDKEDQWNRVVKARRAEQAAWKAMR